MRLSGVSRAAVAARAAASSDDAIQTDRAEVTRIAVPSRVGRRFT